MKETDLKTQTPASPAAVAETVTPVLEQPTVAPVIAASVAVKTEPEKTIAPAKKDAKKEPKKEETLEALGLKLGAKRPGALARLSAGLSNFGLGKEKNNFIENLAILLNSGLSVIDAIRTIAMEVRVKPMKKILQKIIDDVESGIALWRAMDNQNFFSPYALALIRIGEEAGSLSKNMEYLSAQQEKSHALKSKVKSAMIYPSIVLVMTLTITLGLAWFVLPQLVGVLISLNAELPFVTRIVIAVANYFRDNGKVAVPLVFGALFFVFLVCKYTGLRGPAQMFVFKIPGIGTMAKSATIAQFGVILGSLLRAGVPLVESIKSMAEVTDTVAYKKFYFRLADEIEVGESFSNAFTKLKESKKLIPISVQQLVITGERSGKIADMLMRIADIYEKKAEEAAQRLPVVLEPMLLLFMGGLVGTIAYAIIVPIYSVVGNVGR